MAQRLGLGGFRRHTEGLLRKINRVLAKLPLDLPSDLVQFPKYPSDMRKYHLDFLLVKVDLSRSQADFPRIPADGLRVQAKAKRETNYHLLSKLCWVGGLAPKPTNKIKLQGSKWEISRPSKCKHD
ncbi:hypothetical protein U737_23850 [Methylomonas sp. LW13]|nr:hypothetical protein CWO84_12000 [Methylomonas sp. Kb3]QBC29707.1 hypothetical protein U737_23850 [Methylomonas sp. LW13]